MADKDLFVFVASYSDEEQARLDYETLNDLHAEGVVGSYDAAILRKDEDGKVHLRKHEKPTQHGVEAGVIVGALAGILFPPSILASAVVTGVAGGLIGHFWKGMSRADMKELGEFLDESEAALVVVGESKLEEYLEREIKRAEKRMAKEIKGDVKDFEKALEELNQ
ncbi:MAG: DUF1269 domain-containing protein [Actinomycetota bacterium]|nr:DUF1269 domain-containing protein [Actinomycetota bacterium]